MAVMAPSGDSFAVAPPGVGVATRDEEGRLAVNGGADRSVVDEGLDATVGLLTTALVADHQLDSSAGRRLDRRPPVGNVEGERLFDEDVDAGLGRELDLLPVHGVGRCEEHGLDVIGRQ